MKKIIFIILLNLTFMNAYTLILKDNSVVKGELIKVNDNYTQLVINEKETIVLNSLIKKRFFTPEEKAVIEKNKQLITTEVTVNSANNKTISDKEIYGIKAFKKDNSYNTNQQIKTSKINLFINLDCADTVYITGTSISTPGSIDRSSKKQAFVIGLGAEYSSIIFNETRYSLGAILQLERSLDIGKYSGTSVFCRLEQPFDIKNKNNFIGFEINMFYPTFSNLASYFTNNKAETRMGFAIYERRYIENIFFELGFKTAYANLNTTISGDEVNYLFNSPGFYFLSGMSF